MRRHASITQGRLLTAILISLTLLSGFLVAPTVAYAQRDAEKVCNQIAKKAQRDLWHSFRDTTDELFCRKPWLKDPVTQLDACGLSNTAHLLTKKVKNVWNRFFSADNADWATWGPRGIGGDWEEGTIRKGFKRTFFGPGLAYNTPVVEVVKEGGRAEANITVCEISHDGKVIDGHRKVFSSGRGGEGDRRKFELKNRDTRIIGVVVDTPFSVNAFEYRARLLNEPIRNNLGPVKGIADLHVHQIVDLAFGGRMYWGSHTGPKKLALAPEVITGRLDPTKNTSLVGKIIDQFTETGVDANVILSSVSGVTDEGFYSLGTGGHPGYKDWPHHADRSHQQVHISWVKEAHERRKDRHANLNLMVVSVVNNDILCNGLKHFDPLGNVAERNSAGDILKWESETFHCDDDNNVVRQLKAIHDLENQYPWYRVAMSPWHARQIIDDGDLAVVISLETDKPLSGPGGNYGDFIDQLDKYRALGLATMQIVHESDSRFCGAALHRDLMGALQAVHWPIKSLANLFRSPFKPTPFNRDGNQYNGVGLKRNGEKLVDELVKRNMPIDLAHGSERCRIAVMERVPKGYGLYDSHTKFKRLLEPRKKQRDYGTDVLKREQEFLITDALVKPYLDHQVLVGLRTASVDVYSARNAAVQNDCPGSAKSFAQLIQHANDVGLTFAYGTDFNTGVSQLGPRFGPGRCWAAHSKLPEGKRAKRQVGLEGPLPKTASQIAKIDGTDYYVDGLATIGWLPELTVDLMNLETPGAEKLTDSAEAFISMWQRAYDAPGAGIDVTDNNTSPRNDQVAALSLKLGESCHQNDQCISGRCSGVVGTRGVCVCDQDNDCADGKFCNMGLDIKVNACQALKKDNEKCDVLNGGRTCASGQCRFGRCYTPQSVAMGGLCYNDDACVQGKCSAADGFAGSCVCKSDGDCNKGFWCDGGLDLKKNQCKAKLKKGEVCGKSGELGTGHRCKSGKCAIKGINIAGPLYCK